MSHQSKEKPEDGGNAKGGAIPNHGTGDPAHPIFPTLKRWAGASRPPLIPFCPPQQFKQELANAPFHKEAKLHILVSYQSAGILSMILCGRYDRAIHELTYRAAWHRLGFALCQAAFFAHRTGRETFAIFSVSTHLPGFLEALEAWTHSLWPDDEFDWKAELPWINRNLVGEDEEASKFWIMESLHQAPDTRSFTRELAAEVNRADAAERMQTKRGTKRELPKFKNDIKVMWIAGALWCRNTTGILLWLDGQEPDAVSATKRIDRDISDLEFSASRRPDHQQIIDEAGK